MLSPVPFRICCIAAMAPALTEAASQAESFSLPHSPAASSVCQPASPPTQKARKFRDHHHHLWDGVSLAALANVKLLRLRDQAPAHSADHAAAAMNRLMGLSNGSAAAPMLPGDRAEPAPPPARVPPLRPHEQDGGGTTTTTTPSEPGRRPGVLELLELARSRRGLLERRADRLQRRIRRLQLRQAVQHTSGQMAAFFEHQQTSLGLPCLMPQRLLHRKLRDSTDLKAELLLQSEDVKNLSTAALVSLVRKLEESHGAPADLRLSAEDRAEGDRVAGTLRCTLAHHERAIDSDATESSSGGESGDDEPCSRNLPSLGGPLLPPPPAPTPENSAATLPTATPAAVASERKPSIRQTATWRWSLDRAAVASRWTWLQAQVADLEFRIRQQTDLCRQLRRAKGPVRLEGDDQAALPTLALPPSPAPVALNGEASEGRVSAPKGPETQGCAAAEGASTTVLSPAGKPNGLVLPSPLELLSSPPTAGGGCARTRPLAAGFRKRKVVVAASALASARKSARLSATVQCPCRSVCGPTSPGAAAAGWGSGFASSQAPHLPPLAPLLPPPSPLSPTAAPTNDDPSSSTSVETPPEVALPPLPAPPPPPPPPSASPDYGGDAPGVSLPPLSPCLVCGGRYNSMRPLDAELMTRQEKASLLDPGFHPVLSFSSDIPLNLHFEMLLRTGELQKLALRASATLRKKSRLAQVTGLTVDQVQHKKNRKLAHNAAQTLLSSAKMRKHHSDKKRPYRRHLDGEVTTNESCYDGSFRRTDGSYSLMSMKQRERQRTFSTASGSSSKAGSPVPSPAPSVGEATGSQLVPGGVGAVPSRSCTVQDVLRRRRGENAFDINNIVIPYSIASATRVERLPYKEILTPKWRVLSEEELSAVLQDIGDLIDEVEDMSDEAFESRHQVCEEEEKQRFAGLLSKAASSSQAKAPPLSSGAQVGHHHHHQPPCHRQPYDPLEGSSLSPPPAGLPFWTEYEADPYEHRIFPLPVEEWERMLSDSLHLLPSPLPSPPLEGEEEEEEAAPHEPPEPQAELAAEPDPGTLSSILEEDSEEELAGGLGCPPASPPPLSPPCAAPPPLSCLRGASPASPTMMTSTPPVLPPPVTSLCVMSPASPPLMTSLGDVSPASPPSTSLLCVGSPASPPSMTSLCVESPSSPPSVTSLCVGSPASPPSVASLCVGPLDSPPSSMSLCMASPASPPACSYAAPDAPPPTPVHSGAAPNASDDPEWTVVSSEKKENLVLKLTKR
ncbi:non-specific lethal 1 [Haemaphysalis longicornis]